MVVTNRRWGGWITAPLRFAVVLLFWLPLPLGVLFAMQLSKFADELPEVPDLNELQPSFPSRVETVDGWYLGGARVTENVPYHELPPHLIGAVLAAEDEDFFSHQAFSTRGILRAALENYRLGRPAQGASTITQQVARQFMTTEKTYDRKIKELLLARRLESTYGKSEILSIYLGGVFWGHTAHGATQASWHYFGKSPTELDVGEAALLAGVLPAPSRFSPLVDLERAREERARVLRRMTETGMLTEREAARWTEAPIRLRRRDDDVSADRMPYAFQTGLRFATELGDEIWASGGLRIVVPHRPLPQALARRALRQAVTAVDRRQGWRGAAGVALEPSEVDRRLEAQPPGRFGLARVVAVDRRELTVVTRGGETKVGLGPSSWAEPAETRRHYKRPVRLTDFTEILAENDLVFLDWGWSELGRGGKDASPLLDSVVRPTLRDEPALAQVPIYEGAVTSIDSSTGRLLAAVGGYEPERSEFDRVFRGCRQPGSVFKPVVYAQALSSGLTAATMLSDSPTEVATGRGGVWRPRNADRDFKGYVTLANALAWSRNIPTVHLMDYLGPRRVVGRAKRLGIRESVLDTTSSVSLGASCVRPYEVAQVFAAFQRRGRTVGVSPVAWWYDAQSAARDDTLHFAAEDWRTAARMARMARVEPLPDRGVSENVAHIMLDLLRRVVTSGTANDLPDEWLVAGKTGTTNEFDAWFVGFDGEQTVVSWVGSDKNEDPLGNGEHGATSAMPVFAAYYEPFARTAVHESDDEYPPQPPPPGVEYHAIDPATGLLAPAGEWGISYPFVTGTAPRDYSPSRGAKQADRFDELIYDF